MFRWALVLVCALAVVAVHAEEFEDVSFVEESALSHETIEGLGSDEQMTSELENLAESGEFDFSELNELLGGHPAAPVLLDLQDRVKQSSVVSGQLLSRIMSMVSTGRPSKEADQILELLRRLRTKLEGQKKVRENEYEKVLPAKLKKAEEKKLQAFANLEQAKRLFKEAELYHAKILEDVKTAKDRKKEWDLSGELELVVQLINLVHQLVGTSAGEQSDKKTFIDVDMATGKERMAVPCAAADHKCQAQKLCEYLTRMKCEHQTFDCSGENKGSFYPQGYKGNKFNFAYSYENQNQGGKSKVNLGNICSCDVTMIKKFHLQIKQQHNGCDYGHWYLGKSA